MIYKFTSCVDAKKVFRILNSQQVNLVILSKENEVFLTTDEFGNITFMHKNIVNELCKIINLIK